MNKQIKKVIYYIEQNIDEKLDLVKLAKIACYSDYHFCRIFKVNVGESVMSYATRLKLERAVIQMRVSDKNTLEVALDAGYETHTGFIKAFKKHFGTTPTKYTKIYQQFYNNYKDIKMNTPEIVTRNEVYVVFTRESGEYEKSSTIAWQRLTAEMNNLDEAFRKRPPTTATNLGKSKGEALGICHDDPTVTQEENIRYDAALAWDKADVAELTNYGFDTKTIAGGKYARVLYKGYDNADAWYGLYSWVEKKGYTFRDVPPFEKYLNVLEEGLEKKDNLVEIYVPIE